MRVVINPKYEYLQSQIENIPKQFEKEGEVVYDGRNVLKRACVEGIDIVVKSFKKPHLVNRFVYSYFRKSKAARSYFYSMEIMRSGFGTPEPVAMIEQSVCGLLSHSYYVCRYDDGETVRSLMSEAVAGNEDKLKAFARFTVDLHDAGILHLDYSPGNILIHSIEHKYRFSLVDVNRMQILSKIDCDIVCRNMCRLCTSREVLTYIMAEYATLRGWDVSSTIKLALYYSDQFFTRYIYRRAAKKEKSKHIVSYILLFRIFRSMRKGFFWLPFASRTLLKKEKHIYDTYLSKYDYCALLTPDYQ